MVCYCCCLLGLLFSAVWGLGLSGDCWILLILWGLFGGVGLGLFISAV